MPDKPDITNITALRADDAVKTLVNRNGRATACKIALRPNGSGWRWLVIIYHRLCQTGRADNYDNALSGAEAWIREHTVYTIYYE